MLFVLLMILPTSIAIKVVRNPILDGGFFAVLALALAYLPVRVLVNSVTAILGKISFSMYLTHFAVLESFSRLGVSALFPRGDISSVLYFFCVVAATVLVSFFLYKGFELPWISCGRRIIGKLERGYTPSPTHSLRMTPNFLFVEGNYSAPLNSLVYLLPPPLNKSQAFF